MKFRPKQLLIIAVSILLYSNVFSQGCPNNLDFEEGTFNNWQCFVGTVAAVNGKNVMTLAPSSPTQNRHEIISSPTALDPYGDFHQLCPYGGNYSVRLGNDSGGAQAEALSYEFTVPTTVDTFTFTYFYAVVLHNPGHLPDEQPRFFVPAYDVASGQVVNCASYDYVSSGAIPGFEKSKIIVGGDIVLYKNWTPASLQFAGLKGRKVRLEFRTADCTFSKHFGYAYLDVGNGCSNILATAPYCRETNSVILNAPYGFKDYIWYTEDFSTVLGNERTLTLSPPPTITGGYRVDVIPYPGYGCRDTLSASVHPLPVPDTPVAQSVYTYCQFANASPFTATPKKGNDLLWYSSTNSTGSDVPITPSTSQVGSTDYYVSQKVLFGCESFLKKITVHVIPRPKVSFAVNQSRQCQNNNLFITTNNSSAYDSAVFSWDLGDGHTISSNKDTNIQYSYTNSGNYNIVLNITNRGTCSAQNQQNISVLQKPTASFSYPPIICQNQTPIVVTDKSFITGVPSTINYWWWNINGKAYTGQTISPPIPTNKGNLSMQLVVKNIENCISDTNNVEVPIYEQPVANFSYASPACNNKAIQFTNLSLLPSAINEQITKWNWLFNGNISSFAKDTALNLPSGNNTIDLVVESDKGCKSLNKDSIIFVNSKPTVVLNINDSCVNRDINYSVVDLSKDTNKWLWNFGKGFYQNQPAFTTRYSFKDSLNITVIGENTKGCTDTLYRVFKIYDNVAFAGNDTITAKLEPVYLNANGYPGTTYIWSPSTGLTSDTIGNPVAIWGTDQLYKLYTITKEGCDRSSQIMIKRFAGPELYIPTAFSPNGNLSNQKLKVLPVGIKSITTFSFSVYNRWGQLLFTTKDPLAGWDGTFNGAPSEPGTYIAVAQAIDYKGKSMITKVPVVLFR